MPFGVWSTRLLLTYIPLTKSTFVNFWNTSHMWTYFIDEPLRLFYKIHSYTSKEHFIRSCHAHHSSQTYDHICNKKSQIWEKPHRRPSHRESYWLQWDAPHLPPKLPLTLRQSPLPSNTSIPRPITLTTPNGIQIQSAVLSQYRQTHGISNRPVRIPTYTLLYYKRCSYQSSGMYTDYVVWRGELGGPVDDLFESIPLKSYIFVSNKRKTNIEL